MSNRSWFPGVHLLGALALAGWAVLALVSHRLDRPLPVFLGVMAWEWLIFLAVWRLVARGAGRELLRPMLAWAAVFLVCGLFAKPVMEDDYFRYLWDGRQCALTGNPYAAPPAAFFGQAGLPEGFQQILDEVNYPHVPTIYGPVCQFAFALSYGVAPGQLWSWKAILFVAALGLLAVVIAIVRGRDESPGDAGRQTSRHVLMAALVAGWCPLAVFETGFNAHPDALGILALSAVWLCRLRDWNAAGGVLCGVAGAVKVFALPFAPLLLWRSGRAWAGFAVGLIGAYAPFWLQGSTADWTGLASLATGWEFNSSLYALARLAFGAPAARIVCAVLFLVAWFWLSLRAARQGAGQPYGQRALPGLEIFGVFFLVSATVNPWYLLWMIPFAAVRPSITAIAAMALVCLSYVTGLNLGDAMLDNFEHPGWVRPVEYGGVALVMVAELWHSRLKAKGQALPPVLHR